MTIRNILRDTRLAFNMACTEDGCKNDFDNEPELVQSLLIETSIQLENDIKHSQKIDLYYIKFTMKYSAKDLLFILSEGVITDDYRERVHRLVAKFILFYNLIRSFQQPEFTDIKFVEPSINGTDKVGSEE